MRLWSHSQWLWACPQAFSCRYQRQLAIAQDGTYGNVTGSLPDGLTFPNRTSARPLPKLEPP